MNGLLIAYSFGPQKNVGALRPTYWAEEIGNVNSGIKLDVITSVDNEVKSPDYQRIVVPNIAGSIWSLLIKDEGLTWRKDLKRQLRQMDLSDYQFVILTGGPFFHFSIGKYLKRAGLKVIYDFRDPFSYNPRFNERGIKKWVKKWYERRFLKSADLVLSVNEECHEYIGDRLNLNRGILPNGFDERNVKEGLLDQKIETDIFYAGKFYWNPDLLFDVLEENKWHMDHAGPEINCSHKFLKGPFYHSLGMLDQETMYRSLARAEIGVLLTMDVPFESTTKIYDYIGLNKKILIITKGEPGKGALNRELEAYPFFKWVCYNKQDIETAIEDLKAMKVSLIDVSLFSRKEGLKKLVEYIVSVCDE